MTIVQTRNGVSTIETRSLYYAQLIKCERDEARASERHVAFAGRPLRGASVAGRLFYSNNDSFSKLSTLKQQLLARNGVEIGELFLRL
ncbi:hypothetical protein EVAR_46230_1 [Eumeta japonica]|uniref:Uncharacterized protein n=1 Tax=Eumeta variegata TaxID=151549 RepID=A0A4C1XKN4_EUMVA|nr:hypothetical protein EVAR_46230_1 [Eumeta japonica]